MDSAALLALFAAAAIKAEIPAPGMLLATLLLLVVTCAVLLGTVSVSMALFDSLLAVVPQFVDVGSTSVPDMLVVTLGILVITAVPMLAVSVLAAGSGRLLQLHRHWPSRAGGVAILGFAAMAALGLD